MGANAIAAAMAGRGRGQIVLIGSIAESFPLPMAPTYAATKAGLRMFAEALGIRLAKHGVGVTLVSPGFIDTAMSRQVTEPKPFLMSADKAAAIIARGIARARPHHRAALAVRGDPRLDQSAAARRAAAGACRAHDDGSRPWPGIGSAGADKGASAGPARGSASALAHSDRPAGHHRPPPDRAGLARNLGRAARRSGFLCAAGAAVPDPALRRLFRLSQSVGHARMRRPWR